MLHAARSLAILATLGTIAACEPTANFQGSGEPLAPMAPSQDNTPYLYRQVETQLQKYISALLAEDEVLLLSVASSELGSRIATRGPEGNIHAKAAEFMTRESRKLNRELRQDPSFATVQPSSLTLANLQLQSDGAIAVASVMLNGRLLLKNVYLVYEDESYKVNLVLPKGSNDLTTTSYRAQNDDSVARSYSCSGNGPYSIGIKPSQRLLPCQDSCRNWWFDGTTFEAQGNYTDCDYNTWGIDMYIRDGHPVCSDPC